MMDVIMDHLQSYEWSLIKFQVIGERSGINIEKNTILSGVQK